MRAFSYADTSGHVTKMALHHSIRYSRKPHDARMMQTYLVEPELWATEVVQCGNRDFLLFCSCDLDLDPMTFTIISTGAQKVRNLASFKTSLKCEPPTFENATRYPKSETHFLCINDRPMTLPSLVNLGPLTHP